MEGIQESVDLKDSVESGTEKADSTREAPAAEPNDEEDVPPDFFDDFSNQDFMEGLDIVDTWDEEGQISDSPIHENEDNTQSENASGKETPQKTKK